MVKKVFRVALTIQLLKNMYERRVSRASKLTFCIATCRKFLPGLGEKNKYNMEHKNLFFSAKYILIQYLKQTIIAHSLRAKKVTFSYKIVFCTILWYNFT